MREISDNVIKIVSDLVDEYASSREIASTTIQAYLTECRQVFDKDDERTWPKETLFYDVRYKDGSFDRILWNPIYYRGSALLDNWDKVEMYLNIADIMPEGM